MSNIAERRKYILESITEKGFVKVADLATALGVTQTTIRKDLSALEEKGVLYRAYGSAMTSTAPVLDVNLNTKRLFHFNEKQRIGAKAAELIAENDSIIVSAGSTMGVFAENIKPKGRLSVVTPAVNVSMLLGDMTGVNVMQLGGILYGNSMCVTGGEAISQLQHLRCTKVFFGVDGVDPKLGASCATPEEAAMTHKMIEVCSKVIVLADSSKIGFSGFGHICEAGEIDILVTDGGITPELKKAFEAQGVQVIVC